MRAQLGGNARAQEFSDVHLSLGKGTLPEERGGQVVLPESLGRVVSSLEELIRCVYGDISRITYQRNSWVCERAILTPKNDQAAAINECILSEIERIVVVSINTVVEQDDATHYPVEFLNSLSASGLPAHTIKLKVGVPIMFLRNLSPPKLFNGTRLKVHRPTDTPLRRKFLQVVASARQYLYHAFPSYLITSRSSSSAFSPVSVCFAMTINKSQGAHNTEGSGCRPQDVLLLTRAAVRRLLSRHQS